LMTSKRSKCATDMKVESWRKPRYVSDVHRSRNTIP
jgi:hypothetical protein